MSLASSSSIDTPPSPSPWTSETQEANNNNNLNKLKDRLDNAGITNYNIISDNEMKSNNNNLIVAKSLVWCMNDKEYIMCVVTLTDYIHERLLIEQITLLKKIEIDKINLAGTKVAEYQS